MDTTRSTGGWAGPQGSGPGVDARAFPSFSLGDAIHQPCTEILLSPTPAFAGCVPQIMTGEYEHVRELVESELGDAHQPFVDDYEDALVGDHDGSVMIVPSVVVKELLFRLSGDIERSVKAEENFGVSYTRRLVLAQCLLNVVGDDWNLKTDNN